MTFYIQLISLTVTIFVINKTSGQVYLRADSTINTYTRINSVLGGTAVEVPDCAHPSFGEHIRTQYDSILKRDIFAFYAHVTPDNDNCNTFDRQRNEIKTYNPSSEYLKGRIGETVTFSWNFKLNIGFQPSSSFTHIHQLKAKDGDDGSPIITLTPRYGNPNILQLIHINSAGTTTIVKTTPLGPFLGEWVHVTEKITYNTSGKYTITITRVSNGAQLFTYTNNNMDLWRKGANFVRPKWGIYRSLNNKERLRDETVLFDTFCLAKGTHNCP